MTVENTVNTLHKSIEKRINRRVTNHDKIKNQKK